MKQIVCGSCLRAFSAVVACRNKSKSFAPFCFCLIAARCWERRWERCWERCCKDDSLVTRNLVPGESVYGEKRLVAESADGEDKCPG